MHGGEEGRGRGKKEFCFGRKSEREREKAAYDLEGQIKFF